MFVCYEVYLRERYKAVCFGREREREREVIVLESRNKE